MKHFTSLSTCLLVLIFLFPFNTDLNAQGWRQNEMEVKVQLESRRDAETLANIHLNGDIYSTFALMYVTPAELEQLKGTGLDYEITKENLNEYYRGFWEQRDEYHTYEEIIYIMDSLADALPGLVSKTVYGESVGGRELSALKISDNVDVDEPEPEIAFDGNIHGDEIGGGENMIRFARWICQQYGENSVITDLVDSREIWIFPLVNPDGRESLSRYNNNGVDLNRDWGYIWNGEGGSWGPYSQPESKALRQMVLDNQFVIHMTLHSGIEMFLHPWYFYEVPCPDSDESETIADMYAGTSGYSDLTTGPGTSLYPTTGSTAESYYGVMGSQGIVMELSYNKQPPASQIMYYYNINLQPSINLIEYAGYGIEGMITDSETGDPVAAIVYAGDKLPVYSDPEVGDYHKFLLDGTYNIKVKANGYETKIINNVSVEDLSTTVLNIELDPADHQSIYRVLGSQRPESNSSNEQPAWEVIGPPDNMYYSMDDNGWIVVDMQELVLDGPGSDLIVFEGDTSPEGFDLLAGPSVDGPWTMVGTGSGTTEFDLADSQISEARYFKIEDDNDGSSGTNAGFDLDAMQSVSSIAGAYILLEAFTIDDAQGNNNGVLDPGETADLIVTLKNIGTEDATNVLGELSVEDEWVEVLTTEPQEFGDLLIDQSASATFTVSADENTPFGHVATLQLDYSGDNISGTKYLDLEFEDYCYPTADCSWGDGFTGFALAQIDNMDNGCSNDNGINGYGDFTDMIAELAAGETYTVEWETGYSSQFASLWIDYNHDREFSNEERFIEDFSMDNSGQVYTTDFTLPDDLNSGTYRMRIRARWLDSSADPCANFSYGETEDYTVVIEGQNTIVPQFEADLTELCAGGTVQFTDLSQGTVTSWQWEFPGGDPATSNLQDPEVTYADAGTFDVTLTVSNQTVSESITYEDFITVFGLPDVSFVPLDTLCINWPPYELTEGSPEGGEYSGPGVMEGWFYPDEAGLGTHTLTYTYTDENGCENFAQQSVYVDACTGIREYAGQPVVRPNPTEGDVEMVFPAGVTDAKLRVVNTFGEMVYSRSGIDIVHDQSVHIDLSGSAPGLYLIIVEGEKRYSVRVMLK